MAGLTVEVVDLDKVFGALDALGPAVMDAAQEAAIEEANYELTLTKAEVPVDTGALYETGRVELVDNDAGEVTAAIAYGDETVDYALAVHEDLEAVHPHGKAKYVEDPVRAELNSGRAAMRMGETISRLLNLGASNLYGRFKARRGFFTRGAGGKFTGSSGG